MDAREYAAMDAAEDAMWWYRALHARLLSALAGVSGRVLDAGCGTGGFLARLRARRPDLALAGVEWDAGAAARAAEKSHAAVARGSVNALPFADRTFAAAVAADVLSHAEVDPSRALAELRRVLRPGGVLVLNMPAHAWLMSAHDRRVHNARRWSAAQTRATVLRAGFGPVRACYWNSLLLPLMAARRRVFSRAEAGSDVAVFPPWLDATLHAVTEVERRLRLRLPAGGSVLAVATRIET